MQHTVYTERRRIMNKLHIPSTNTDSNRTVFRKFYRYSMIAYWPLLFLIGYVFDIISNGSFLDFNLWQCLLLLLLLTLPLYLCYAAIGQLVLFLISDKTAKLPPNQYKLRLKLHIAGIVSAVIAGIGIGIIGSL